jgi:hypothetical protein
MTGPVTLLPVLFVAVLLSAGCGGASVKLSGSPNGVKIGGLLVSNLNKEGHKGIASVGCQDAATGGGYRCDVTMSSSALICDADGTGLSGRGTSRLVDATCDTRSHYHQVVAQTGQLVDQALQVLNQDTQLTTFLAAYQNSGASLDCLDGLATAGHRVTDDVDFYLGIASTTPGIPTSANIVVTPQGQVTVKANAPIGKTAPYGGCSFDGSSFSISDTPRPNMPVSATAHAEVVATSQNGGASSSGGSVPPAATTPVKPPAASVKVVMPLAGGITGGYAAHPSTFVLANVSCQAFTWSGWGSPTAVGHGKCESGGADTTLVSRTIRLTDIGTCGGRNMYLAMDGSTVSQGNGPFDCTY